MKETRFFPFLNKEALLENIMLEPAYCHKSEGCYLAKVSFKEDFSPFLAYLKPQVKALYYEPQKILIFKWKRGDKFYRVNLQRDILKFGVVSNIDEAREVFSDLFEYLKECFSKFGEYEPDLKPIKRPQALEIYKYLPKTNCRDCGELSCLAFSAKISMAEAEPEDCPHLDKKSLKLLRSLFE